MREEFVAATTALLDDDPRVALVLADISAANFKPALAKHPERVINVGIREQLMASVAGGLSLTGLRPYLHSYATFAVDRAYEQLKLDLRHQGAGAVVVTIGASYDGSAEGYTHQSPGDVALLDTLDGWTVHVPGHPGEVADLIRQSAAGDDQIYIRLSTEHNDTARANSPLLQVQKHGSEGAPLVLVVGPLLDATLAAVADLDVTVAYTRTPRPLDTAGLRALAGQDIILVEPYQAGTSAHLVTQALTDRPHRLLTLGVGHHELRNYGKPSDHAQAHGLDTSGLHHSIAGFLKSGS